MIDHISVGANDIAAARAFYLPVLATLGLTVSEELAGRYVDFGAPGSGGPEFSIETPTDGRAATPGNGVQFAFRAPSRLAVDAFHAAALAAGGTDAGAPGPRPHYGSYYYGAFVFDLDGNKIEAVCHAASEGTGPT